jgi:hypothetical protein
MKMKNVSLFVNDFVVPQEDAPLIRALRMSIDLSEDQDDFSGYKHPIAYFNMPHHFIIRHGQSIDEYSRSSLASPVLFQYPNMH